MVQAETVKSRQKCPDFECSVSSFQMVGTIGIASAKTQPFENRTILNPTVKKCGFQILKIFKWSDFRSPLYIED